MALQISIYNKQQRTSASDKSYLARVCVFNPGQSGRLTEADQVPPFYIRDQKGGKQWIRLDARSIAEAKVEAAKAQDVMVAAAAGLDVLMPGSENGQRLTVRIAAYLEEVEANKSRATWLAYNRSLELFKESCRRQNVQDVRREDILAFKTYLRKKKIEGRSLYNHFLNTSVFFGWAGQTFISMGIKKNDWAPKPEREAEAYDEDQIAAMMKAASDEERLLLKAFLNSGLRDGEMMHLSYGDIDARNSIWTVQPKKGHNLKTEESQRRVPVHESITKKIMERMKAQKKTAADLIFPAKNGKADGHMIRIVKRVAKKAGVQGRVDSHKFRSTAITLWLRNGSTVPEVMAYCGHVNPSTILRYAANVNLAKKDNRDKVTKPFETFAAMGE
jgi:integrase